MTDEKQIRKEIKQDFEKRKKEYEQVEEMAKDIFESKVAIDGTDMAFGLFDEDDHFHRIARFLYKHNYRKLPENAVVIPEKITEETSPEDIIKIAKYNETIRKETAREIYEYFNLWLGEDFEEMDDCSFMHIMKKDFIRERNELAKRYGVEVEE